MKYLISIIVLFFTQIAIGQYTLIPDAVFESRLISQGIDSEGTLDGQVLTSDIDQLTELYIFTANPDLDPLISDLTGIEDFINLEILNFAFNEVTEVDLTNLANLKSLNVKSNNLITLDVSNNSLLETLDAANCFPGTCEMENTFSELNFSNNPNLRRYFVLFNNYLEDLDFSSNSSMELVDVRYCNSLSSLNLKNGNNVNLDMLNATNMTVLDCIEVDDPVAATNGTDPPYSDWQVDPNIIFSKDCSLGHSEQVLDTQIQLFPTQVEQQLFVQIDPGLTVLKIEFYNSLGQLVLTEDQNYNPMDVSQLPSGLLLVKITTQKGVITKKVLKK